ncbi:MAG: PD40 domain-containing protein, partial [Bdellovibrionales bacterium]|nr:PD40 domain-containing protein [Bdellovibrionales bacterium]
SPDGNEVAFCSNRGGGPQIYVMGASGGRARRLSFTNSSYCTSPAWSPKGDKIAFVCRKSNGNQLFLSNVDGTQVSQLTFAGNNEDPVWSPDSSFLSYSTDAGTGGGRNIVISSLLGGSPVQITFSKSEDSQPAWSPRLE